MKIEDVIRQLQSSLPKFTDKFTDNFSVSSLTRSGTTVTAVTAEPHLLKNGDFAYILGAKNPITISNLVQTSGIATATTATDHNKTFSQAEKNLDQLSYVDIDGATETEYNGTHELLSTLNRREFTYSVDDTATSPATGTPLLLEEGGYNGWKEVTVIDTITFTYEIEQTPNSPAVGTIETRLRPRISGAVTDEKAVNAYTKHNQDVLWAFVVMGDKVANKNREVMSDATSTPGSGAEYRQLVIQPFSVYAIFPATTDSIAGRQERDDADDLVLPFTKSLLRVKFPTGFAEDAFSGVVFSADRFFFYNNAIYIHEYEFETTAWVTYDDTVDPEEPVAFRDIFLNFETSLSETAGKVMTAEVDLDEEQLT